MSKPKAIAMHRPPIERSPMEPELAEVGTVTEGAIGEAPGSAAYLGRTAEANPELYAEGSAEEVAVGDPPGGAAYFGELGAGEEATTAGAIAESGTGFPPGGMEYVGGIPEERTGVAPYGAAPAGFAPGSVEYLGRVATGRHADEVASATAAAAAPQRWGEWFRASDDVRTGFLSGNTFADKPVTYNVINGVPIFEGDIALGETQLQEIPSLAPMDQVPSRGVGITGDQYRWPGGVLPWQCVASLRTMVTSAIGHWQANTGIRFVERTAANAAQFPDYVSFEPLDGCWSYVGKQGGKQVISIGAGCGFGATVH